jgi:anti-sigma regulatory factor (Ser/Thr protein kinase)
MGSEQVFLENFMIKGGDFADAGEASCRIRQILSEIGVEAAIIRRVAIASYEAEMNVVMFARQGTMRLLVTPHRISVTVEDKGQGIGDIELAMQPGYSTATEEMREMGFGAGMGLPNMRKNSDVFNISSVIGKGTKLEMLFVLNGGAKNA